MQVIADNAMRFLEEMNTEAIAAVLRAEKLIPQDVQRCISQSKTSEDANGALLAFLEDRADTEQVLKILKIAAEKQSEGRMNAFAKKLLQEIRQSL